jgi:hypothetical protein
MRMKIVKMKGARRRNQGAAVALTPLRSFLYTSVMLTIWFSSNTAAAPPPPKIAALMAKADLAVEARIEQWKRVSWFWQRNKIYEATFEIVVPYKGIEEPGSRHLLKIQVFPGLAGKELTAIPEPGAYILFLRRTLPEEKGHYQLVDPPIYAIRSPTENLRKELADSR